MAPRETERDLNRLEADLKRLEAEYNMFFAGRLPRPPWETRNRVAALVRQFDRAYIQNTGDRFRFESLQSRYASLVELWDRGLRSREEGRSGPFAPAGGGAADGAPRSRDRTVHVTAFRDPLSETDKLRTLYDTVVDARREMGEPTVSFDKFADLVNRQVAKLRSTGGADVAFKVSVKEGKVSLTARVLKDAAE